LRTKDRASPVRKTRAEKSAPIDVPPTEAGYVVQGAVVQNPGQPPTMLATGAPILNLRDVAHGGFKVVGPGNLILFTVHTVDKGKPLYDWVK
jgi:hypothetical protein